MGKIVGSVLWGLVSILLYAAVTAAILNLPISGAARFLGLVIVFAISMAFYGIGELDKRLGRIEYWTRLSFIAIHIRNETDGLTPASKRLEEDLALERENDEIRKTLSGSSTTATIIYGTMAIVFLGLVALFLRSGWFGDFSIPLTTKEQWMELLR